eukprot:jgi/Botrbrau1/17809/Bobra.0127s0056.1
MHPERRGAQGSGTAGSSRGADGEGAQQQHGKAAGLPLPGPVKAGSAGLTQSTRGPVRPLQRVPSVGARLTSSAKGKEPLAAPASLLDPALKLRRPGKDDISYNRVLNKAGILVKPVKPPPAGPRSHVGGDWGVWLRITPDGSGETVKVRAGELRKDLGLQPRDLRLLDPALSKSYPSAILARESAILFKMEHIHCIITTEYVLLGEATEVQARAFAEELTESISTNYAGEASSGSSAGRRLLSRSMSKLNNPFQLDSGELPFELRVLEAALDAVCLDMEDRTKKLEARALPCFKMPTAGKVLNDFLDRLRFVKPQIGRLRTKIETMKEVLEDFLDDEDDMFSLNLSARERMRSQPVEAVRRRRVAARLHHLPDSFSLKERTSFDSRSLPLGGLTLAMASYLEHANSFTDKGGLEVVEELEEEEQELEQVEMLLETYFMQLDQLHERLLDMKENIEAAAVMLDIELDNYRNNIIRVRLTTNSGAWMVGVIFSITGCMAMMLGEGKAIDENGAWAFIVTSVAVSTGSLTLLGSFLVYLHRRGLGLTNLSG